MQLLFCSNKCFLDFGEDVHEYLIFFNCWTYFCDRLAEENIEEKNSDVPELMQFEGEEFDVYSSDSDNEDLEFVESFLWSTK